MNFQDTLAQALTGVEKTLRRAGEETNANGGVPSYKIAGDDPNIAKETVHKGLLTGRTGMGPGY